ncbi:MAG: flavodoxin-dependent (E)-4-hydroxy-3-methylbut-2-enyl-diphosphate synthase [Ignavibacteria bacterium]|nr:flavodoxin-dependent (E)-4-hydroxy-3-methylbut-2-enyl-diphosphate synthase [Ignavibacteria bacterium]
MGTNHGSLSDRIMNRYGDTPLGMVESALEFVRICEDHGFYNIVLSMKASNPKVMVQAYRLLVNKMIEENMNYPLHLGVTEAGDGEDGRIKSSAGIGTLLEDGLGDTIRVSLTEEPEFELPVCKRLVRRYSLRSDEVKQEKPIPEITDYPVDPFTYNRRLTLEVDKIGGGHVPVVFATAEKDMLSSPEYLRKIGYKYSAELDKWEISDYAADFIYLGSSDINYALPGTLGKVFDYSYWITLNDKSDSFPLFTAQQYITAERKSFRINFLEITTDELYQLADEISRDRFCVIILKTNRSHAMADIRRALVELINRDVPVPVIIKRTYSKLDVEDLMLYSATDFGGLLTDGLGDGIWLESDEVSTDRLNQISFGILQATRTRISKTEYISCPSCGRTQFDLQKTTAMIKEKTSHLKGVKIAIMGCIVNGPGEMADADYGFVGSGPGWVSLYRGKEVIKRGIPYNDALDELISLMKDDGVWQEQ